MIAIGNSEDSDGGTILFPVWIHKYKLIPTETAAPTTALKGALMEMGTT